MVKILLLFFTFTIPVFAQDSISLKNGTFPLYCTKAENGMFELAKIASDKYGEVPMIIAEMGPGLLILTYNYDVNNPSWSVIITKPGEACFFASGNALSQIPKELVDQSNEKEKGKVEM
jgi:hypothetical protein|tara:strand:+ start:2574 stop:2930 length:357 start_codon:yes stop_codon:yes gene_type:complete